MIERLRMQYNNAREWFHRNCNKPEFRDKALQEYMKASDNYYAVKYQPPKCLVDRLREKEQ